MWALRGRYRKSYRRRLDNISYIYDMGSITVKILETEDGKCPYIKWFKSIKDMKTRIRIQQRIRRIEQGNFGLFKMLGGDLYELKIDFGPGTKFIMLIKINTC